MKSTRIHHTELGLLLPLLLLASTTRAAPSEPTAPFGLVAEMERPAGVLYQSKAERRAHTKSNTAHQGLDQMNQAIKKMWPRIRQVDLVALSKYQVEVTRGFELPETPNDFEGQIVGWDTDSQLWHLELRGPRLPAKYDIVHRYLYLYATFDPETNKIDDLVVTIRGWVLE